MSSPECRLVIEIAPELALGMASGEDRALALGHIAHCEACRDRVGALAAVADDLLLLAPLQEPPPGFESRVLRGIEGRAVRRWRPVAAALAAALVCGLGVWVATGSDRQVASHYRAALAEADGRYFGVYPLTVGAEKLGNLFAYGGHTSWLFVAFEDGFPDGLYRAELESEGGEARDLGSFRVSPSIREWGRIVEVDLRDASALRLFRAEGGLAALARFPD